jgi:hypothetical protein
MKKPKRHSSNEWSILWARIEAFGIRTLARKLNIAPDVIRNWRSRGSIPEYQWENLHRHADIPFADVAGQLRKTP